MRNGARSPLGLTMKPKRVKGIGGVVELDVDVVAHGGNPEGAISYEEVIVVRNEGGGSVGRAFFGRLVEMMTGSSESRRCKATEGRGCLVLVLGRVVIELVEGK